MWFIGKETDKKPLKGQEPALHQTKSENKQRVIIYEKFTRYNTHLNCKISQK